jgi:hypothetical protein
VSQCESLEDAKYDADWVSNALPGSLSASSGKFTPDVCLKFIANDDRNDTLHNQSCPREWFSAKHERCDEWVFDENERTIVNDVRVIDPNVKSSLTLLCFVIQVEIDVH